MTSKEFAVEVIPVMQVFSAWFGLSLAYFTLGTLRTRIARPASESPFVAERSAHARRTELFRQRFGSYSWTYMLVANSIAGTLLYLASAGSYWGAVLCAAACIWLIYDHLASPFALHDIASARLNALDWVYYALGAAVWIYALACVVFPSGELEVVR
jgi:hypothetical protein